MGISDDFKVGFTTKHISYSTDITHSLFELLQGIEDMFPEEERRIYPKNLTTIEELAYYDMATWGEICFDFTQKEYDVLMEKLKKGENNNDEE